MSCLSKAVCLAHLYKASQCSTVLYFHTSCKAARQQLHAKCGVRYGGVMAYPPFSITLAGEPDMVCISDGITPFSITARVHDMAGNVGTAGMPLLSDTRL